MSIILHLNKLCRTLGGCYEITLNVELPKKHKHLHLGFFCIVDEYWGQDNGDL